MPQPPLLTRPHEEGNVPRICAFLCKAPDTRYPDTHNVTREYPMPISGILGYSYGYAPRSFQESDTYIRLAPARRRDRRVQGSMEGPRQSGDGSTGDVAPDSDGGVCRSIDSD